MGEIVGNEGWKGIALLGLDDVWSPYYFGGSSTL
jgi:hypothetical protein